MLNNTELGDNFYFIYLLIYSFLLPVISYSLLKYRIKSTFPLMCSSLAVFTDVGEIVFR